MPNIKKKLTTDQRSDLQQMVATFKANEEAFRENWDILNTIKENELWVEDADSFSEFCEKVLGITRKRGYQLIAAAQFIEDSPPKVKKAITNERQARALAQVPEEDREEVVEKATKGGKELTAKGIEKAASEIPFTKNRKDDKPVVHDALSLKVDDDDLHPIFEQGRSEFKALSKAIKDCCDEAERLVGEDAGFFLKSGWQSLEADLANAREKVNLAMPFSICCYCNNGQGRKECRACKGRGWLSKGLYKAADEKLRALSERKRS